MGVKDVFGYLSYYFWGQSKLDDKNWDWNLNRWIGVCKKLYTHVMPLHYMTHPNYKSHKVKNPSFKLWPYIIKHYSSSSTLVSKRKF